MVDQPPRKEAPPMAVIVSLLVVAVAVGWWVVMNQPIDTSPLAYPPRDKMAKVVATRRVSWPKDATVAQGEAFLRQLFDRDEAVVIENAPTTHMPALTKWTNDYWMHHVPQLPKVCVQSRSKTFRYFDTTHPLTLIPGMRLHPQYEVVPEMSTKEFVNRLPRTTWQGNASWVYYSNALNDTNASLWPDVAPAMQWLRGADATASRVNVWLGSVGATAHLHYDSSHNLFTQVRGTKRFLLADSSSWRALYPFPRLHPGHRQSQVDVDSLGHHCSTLFPDVSNVTFTGVTLSAGEVLYMPPLTWHHVEAGYNSISVNVYRPADVVRRIRAIWSVDLSAVQRRKMAAVSRMNALAMTQQLVHWVTKGSTRDAIANGAAVRALTTQDATHVAQWLQAVTRARWSHVRHDPLLNWEHTKWLRDPSSVLQRYEEDSVCGPEHARHTVAPAVRKLVAVLTQHFADLPTRVRSMVLADFVEEVLGRVVGAEAMVHVMTSCLIDPYVTG